MNRQHLQGSALAIMTCSLAAGAQPVPVETPDAPAPAVYLQKPQEPLNKISLAYRMGLNVKADFKNLGGFAPIGNPGPASGSSVDRTYEQNGYNRVDQSGNAGGLTWFWGYGNPGAVQNDNLVLQSSSSPADRKVEDKGGGEIRNGFELAYSRQLLRGKYGKLAAEIAVGYTPLDISDSSSLRGTVNRILDRYALDGVVPPVAPYAGTYEGPGPLISSSPDRSRTVIQQGAEITGHRSLDSDLFMFRLGPVWEFPIWGKLDGSLSAGLALVYADSEFSYEERVTIADVGTQTRRASGDESDLLAGGYVGAALAYEVMANTDVFAGVYFQTAGTSTTKSDGAGLARKQSVIDLGESLFVSLGISYSF